VTVNDYNFIRTGFKKTGNGCIDLFGQDPLAFRIISAFRRDPIIMIENTRTALNIFILQV
jgi:hypothetical protein